MSSDYTQHTQWSLKSAGPKESAQFTARSGTPSLQSNTRRSQSHRDTIHMIPTPGVGAEWSEHVQSWELRRWIVYPAGLFMIALGFVVIFARLGSVRYNGYQVPVKNAISFAGPEFLTSFFPILLVAPLGWLWIAIDWEVKSFYPYISMARGNVPAQDSVLLDYIRMKSVFSKLDEDVYESFCQLNLCYMVFSHASAQTGNPGQSHLSPHITSSTSRWALGLDPSYATLNNFLAAAGYADSNVTNGLNNPLFVVDKFAIADFQAPNDQFLTSKLTVNTTGIKSEANCTVPSALQLLPSADNFYTISANSTSGCSVLLPINQTNAAEQYGVTLVPNCGPNPADSVFFQPIFFWFFHTRMDNNQWEARGIFCEPFIETYNVTATLDLDRNNLAISEVGAKIDVTNSVNNITGPPLSGKAFNGVVFPPAPDAFTTSRAVSIASTISGAIFRAAERSNTLQSVFDSPSGFLALTYTVYTQHLSILAKSTYFLPVRKDIPANLILLRPRLSVEKLAAYGLSTILITVGIMGLSLVTWFRHERKRIYLHAFPGSIAAALALTSRSGFGELLVPYDTRWTMKTKLDGLRFSLDSRTGAIIADDDVKEDRETTVLGSKELTIPLLGHDQTFSGLIQHHSSPEP
ncbi:hypothetical protein BD410DRAFT_872067 [Rickenella mellea]|uniref:Uncharacterized protein n=1 Tax=Rickenella mellea TaxID=50990 RepID=A0A4Y7PZH2_9AGAM|nr:hypothetical protein BD410DRAFT_872067 [Rickenella mellea]